MINEAILVFFVLNEVHETESNKTTLIAICSPNRQQRLENSIDALRKKRKGKRYAISRCIRFFWKQEAQRENLWAAEGSPISRWLDCDWVYKF